MVLTTNGILKYNDFMEVNTHEKRKSITSSSVWTRIIWKNPDTLKERNISLNQLSFRAEMQRTQLRNYRDNKIQRLDIDILLRLCYVLDCDLYELIEYIPPVIED